MNTLLWLLDADKMQLLSRRIWGFQAVFVRKESLLMRTHAEIKTRPSRFQEAPAPGSWRHYAQYRQALRRAGVQPRLEIGAVDDPLEREADRAAAHVLSSPVPIAMSSAPAHVQRDPTSPTAWREHMAQGRWAELYQYLHSQHMEYMLIYLDALNEAEIDAIIRNADASKTDESSKNRVLAGAWAANFFKDKALTAQDLAIAKEKALTLSQAERKKIVDYLNSSSSEAAQNLLAELNKPFLGYTASGYDFSSRFFRHAGTLGFGLESAAGRLPSVPWTEAGQTTPTNRRATQSFGNSDIIFFSGHQYARYDMPGYFTDDGSNKTFNLKAVARGQEKVKLVVSTSCATLLRDIARLYMEKFPNALVLGYRGRTPANGSVVANAFVENLSTKGLVDLTSPSDLEKVKNSWKDITTSHPGKDSEPGALYQRKVEVFVRGEWITYQI